MIKKLTELDRNKVLKYLYQDPSINIFFIGDIENFGFHEEFQDVYAEVIDGDYHSVLLRYKENILFYSHKEEFNTEYLEVFKQYNYSFISGKKTLTDLIKTHFPQYQEKVMYFAEASSIDEKSIDSKDIIECKTEEDCSLTFDLLHTIHEFDSMKNQEKDDFVTSKMRSLEHSKSYYIKQDNKCVSTVSTVADTTKSAMIVAVATDTLYRQKGYASKLMKHIMDYYFNQLHKTLCLFYDNPAAGKIYKRLGFKDIDKWVMLIRK